MKESLLLFLSLVMTKYLKCIGLDPTSVCVGVGARVCVLLNVKENKNSIIAHILKSESLLPQVFSSALGAFTSHQNALRQE